jgi:hypothetical protein
VRAARLVARVYPTAGRAELEVCADWCAWLFMFDDHAGDAKASLSVLVRTNLPQSPLRPLRLFSLQDRCGTVRTSRRIRRRTKIGSRSPRPQ